MNEDNRFTRTIFGVESSDSIPDGVWHHRGLPGNILKDCLSLFGRLLVRVQYIVNPTIMPPSIPLRAVLEIPTPLASYDCAPVRGRGASKSADEENRPTSYLN